MKEGKTASLIDYLEIIVKWRKFIIRNVIIVTAAAIIISLLLTQLFTATATILPPNPEQGAMLGILSMNVPSGLAGLARMGGVLPGLTTPSDLFAAIMKSDRIKGEIVKKFDLRNEFKTKTMIDAFEALDDITNIEITPEGIISVSVTYKDKYLATDIANSYIEELDKFNTETAMTVGKRYRIFIEQRLRENMDTLAQAEDDLKIFQEKYRTVALDVEIESAIKTIAGLKSQIILLEVKKGALSSSSQFANPYLHDINKELRELKKQLSKIEFGEKGKSEDEFGAGFSVPFSQLPEVSQKYVKLLRNVKVQEAIYELLTQQYEQAKIMELKDTPTVQILDRAAPPEKRSFPRRTRIVIVAFAFSLFFSVIAVFFIRYYKEKVRQDPTIVQKLNYFRSSIQKDISSIIKLFRRK